MNNKTEAEPLHDNLRDLIGQALSDEIAAGAEQPDWCDSREIDRLADAVLAVLPKRRTTLSPELRAALDKAAKTGATVAEVPGGGLVFINRGEQLEDWAELNCPACGGSGHADDARATPAGADDAFAAFCDREGCPSDGDLDVALRKAFDEGQRTAAAAPAAEERRIDRIDLLDGKFITRHPALSGGSMWWLRDKNSLIRPLVAAECELVVCALAAASSSSPAGAQPVADAEPSARKQKLAERVNWTTKQWYAHVGAWENENDQIVFGTVMALRAMMVQFQDVTLYAAGKRAARLSDCAAPVAPKPFMHAIMEPSGAPYLDEFCVATNAEDLHSTLNGLNDSPDAGYTIVPVYTAGRTAPAQPDATPEVPHGFTYTYPPAPPTATQERAWFKEWLAGREGHISVDAVEFGRLAWAERARRATKGNA